ncbi:MAG: phosphotransferase [Alphaproteobacteria bacterium]|nr:phosphotransferase [Alphaproteobacteria bacterium]
MENNNLSSYLETTFNISVKNLSKIEVKSATNNYKAEIVDNGKASNILVKLLPHKLFYEREIISANINSIHFGNEVHFLFNTDKKDFIFENYLILIFNYISDATLKDMHSLSNEEALDLIKFYIKFSNSLTPNEFIRNPKYNSHKIEMMRQANNYFVNKLMAKMNPEDMEINESLCQIIHGDLNYKNIFFKNEKVYSFLDYEDFRMGYPTEDLIRCFMTCYEKQSLFSFLKRKKILKNLKIVVENSNYSKHQWLYALNSYISRKLRTKLKKRYFILFEICYYGFISMYTKKCRDTITNCFKQS